MIDPTPEQVEAARAEYDRSEDMCAALVAAAGAIPQDPSVRVDAATLAEALIEELSDVETGPLSDTPYTFAEVNDDGHLELFERPGSWPTAAIDIPQLAHAVAESLRGGGQ